MPLCSENWKLDRQIPSDTVVAQQLVDEIVAQLNHFQWPSTDVFAAHLALEEAIVNAVEHGNRLDPHKSVQVHAELTALQLSVTIRDEGQGFDPTKLPDPTDSEHLTEPHGRGVLLMRRLMTTVSFNERGNEVTLVKQRSAS